MGVGGGGGGGCKKRRRRRRSGSDTVAAAAAAAAAAPHLSLTSTHERLSRKKKVRFSFYNEISPKIPRVIPAIKCTVKSHKF